MKLILLLFASLFICEKTSDAQQTDVIVTCEFRDWLHEFEYANKLLKLDIPDESGLNSLNRTYYLEWQANCLVLISNKIPDITLKIPLLVRKSITNCEDLNGDQIFVSLKCRFNKNFTRAINGKVDMSYKLIDKKLEIYEVIHLGSDGSSRNYEIGFKDGFIKMKTTLLDKGRIPKY